MGANGRLLLSSQIPDWVPAPLASMIRVLLQPDPIARLRSACGRDDVTVGGALGSPQQPSLLSYDALRAHEMFRDASCTRTGTNTSAGSGDSAEGAQGDHTEALGSMEDALSTAEGVRTVYDRPAVTVPSLRELCLRAMGRAALVLAEATAENGGVRPASPAWMKVRRPFRRALTVLLADIYRIICTEL
jgi:hypothetical protein